MFTIIKRASLAKLVLFLFFIGFLTYVSSFTNKFVWDDHHFFEQNITTQSLSKIKEIFTANTTAGAGVVSNYYRPLTTLTFAIDHQIWGWNPIGFHLTNTILHCVNGILLFLWLVRLGFGKVKSFLLSILFLIHPIQTEAVTYLSSRGDVLYTFFLLVSLYCFTYTLYRSKTKKIQDRRASGRKILQLDRAKIRIVSPGSLARSLQQQPWFFPFLLFLSVVLFPVSILSKEGALTTIPLYAGVLFLFGLERKLSFPLIHEKYKNHVIVLLLIILSSVLYFTLRLTVLNFGDSLNYNQDQSLYSTNLSVRLLTFVTTLPTYVRLLLVPYPLYLERSTAVVTSFMDLWVGLGLLLVTISLALGVYEYRKYKSGWIFFGLIIIFANLASVSGIIPMTGLLRENWLYMPMIGFYMIVFMVISLFFSSLAKRYTRALFAGFMLLCIVFSAMTIQQNYNWRSDIAYFEHNLKFTNTARLHLNLGNAYHEKGEFDKALYHLKLAMKINDIYPQIHHNIGAIYYKQGKLKEAEREFLISLAIDPNYLYVYGPLIGIYKTQNKPEMTLPYYKRLNDIYPDDLKLTILYGQQLLASGKTAEADNQFQKALKLSKQDPKLIQAINEAKNLEKN